jgi:SAM-dependent methyltransferase
MFEKEFSHGSKFTGYMEIVVRLVEERKGGQKIVDIPAGNGRLTTCLRERGHNAIAADINRAGDDYVYANMSEPLPFADGEFDTCICLEGIEHVVDSAALVREFCRVTRAGGRIIISLPNIQGVFSRFHFLCTGCFYQFVPWNRRQLKPGEMIDRGHIAPLSLAQLDYLFENYGARLTQLAGDRWKKKWLFPFLLPFVGLGWIWMRHEVKRQKEKPAADCQREMDNLFSTPLLFSRSLILVFEKRQNHG